MENDDLIREWEARLKKEGLSERAGEHEWLQYSGDPESFPKRRDSKRVPRIKPKTAKQCLRCGAKFFGRPNQKFHSDVCRWNYAHYGTCKRHKETLEDATHTEL